jgi:hypothetical protein
MARNKTTGGAQQQAPAQDSRNPDNPNPGMQTMVERTIDDTDGQAPLVRAPMPGGSYGVIPEAERRVQMGALVASHGLDHKDPLDKGGPQKQARLFKYVGRPEGMPFMYDGQRVMARAGKVFSDACYDVDLIKRQGVPLEEIVEPVQELEVDDTGDLDELDQATA